MSKKSAPKLLPFPIYVLIDDDAVVMPTATLQFAKRSELPNSGIYYVVTKDGLLIHKDSKLLSGLVGVKEIQALASARNQYKVNLPLVPSGIVAKALSFFRVVFDKYQAEAEVMLLYDEKQQHYGLYCPRQKVSFAGVDYDNSELQQFIHNSSWQIVGTIHSHCNFGAYHSATDIADEGAGQGDGIHITLGNVDDEAISISCSICMNEHRRIVSPDKMIANLVKSKIKNKQWFGRKEDRDRYKIGLTKEEQIDYVNDLKEISNEWLPRVEKKTYMWTGGGYQGHQGQNWWQQWQGQGHTQRHNVDDYDEFYGHGVDLEEEDDLEGEVVDVEEEIVQTFEENGESQEWVLNPVNGKWVPRKKG